MSMIEKRTWEEFRAAGLLWWVNRVLHLFGWVVVVNVELDGKISDVYPARCKFRGFDTQSETEGFRQLTAHIASNTPRLLDDAEVEQPQRLPNQLLTLADEFMNTSKNLRREAQALGAREAQAVLARAEFLEKCSREMRSAIEREPKAEK